MKRWILLGLSLSWCMPPTFAYASGSDLSPKRVYLVLRDVLSPGKDNLHFSVAQRRRVNLSLTTNMTAPLKCGKILVATFYKRVEVAGMAVGSDVGSLLIGDCSSDYDTVMTQLGAVDTQVRMVLHAISQTRGRPLPDIAEFRVERQTLGKGETIYHFPVFGIGHGFSILGSHVLVNEKRKTALILQSQMGDYCAHYKDSHVCKDERPHALRILETLTQQR